MKSQKWESYWNSIGHSLLEKQIQRYKARIGYRKLLQAVPEIGISGRVLEVGAGEVWISRMLRAKGWHTIAIDLNSEIAMSNSEMVDSYVIGDMFNIPFKENSFDLVMSCGLLEHFKIDTVQEILYEMRRVGKSFVAWLPTCGLEWKILWGIRNMLGANVFTETYKHRKETLREMCYAMDLQTARVGDVTFCGFLRYMFVYGTWIN